MYRRKKHELNGKSEPKFEKSSGEHAPIPSSLEYLQQSNLSFRALTPLKSHASPM